MIHKTLVLVLLALLAAGCSGGGAADQKATPAPAVSRSEIGSGSASTTPGHRSFASVVELKDAAVAAGYPCTWEAYAEGDGPKYAKEAGQCSDDDVFSIYADFDELEKQLDLIAESPLGINMLVGLNWIINIPESQRAKVQAAIGGEYIGTEEEEPSATPAATGEAAIDKSDIKLTVKIRSKKCYGYGVGCSIEYRIKVTADRTGWPSDGTLDVTYKVTGGKDGPDRNTLTMDLTEGTYEQDGYQYADTRSSGVKLKASVVELEYSEY